MITIFFQIQKSIRNSLLKEFRHSRRACFSAAGNPMGSTRGVNPSYNVLISSNICQALGGLRPQTPPVAARSARDATASPYVDRRFTAMTAPPNSTVHIHLLSQTMSPEPKSLIQNYGSYYYFCIFVIPRKRACSRRRGIQPLEMSISSKKFDF